jgi:Flp pilus assembly protein TadD
VVLPSGLPVNNSVRVTLVSTSTPSLTTYTDNKGWFLFTGLREGNYSIEVLGDSQLYDPTVQEVRLIHATHVTLIITLNEKSPSSDSKSGGRVVSASEADRNVPRAARRLYETGVSLANQGKALEAIEQFKKAIAIYPPYLLARNDLGAQYLKLKQLDPAAEQFEAAVEIDEKALNPRLNLGAVRIEQKRFFEAIDHLSLAVSIDGSSPSARLLFGIASLETSELETAQRELVKAVSLGGSEFAIAHYYLAHVHMRRGERTGAVNELRTYVAKHPQGEKAPQARALLDRLAALQ